MNVTGWRRRYAAYRIRAVNEAAGDTFTVRPRNRVVDRHELTADQAFQLLARASMTANRKLRAVADDLVRTGELRIS